MWENESFSTGNWITSDLIFKTVQLNNVAKYGRAQLTPEQRESLIQGHCDRIHPMLDAIREEEARVQAEFGCPKERARFNSRKSQRKQRALARARAQGIAARRA